MQVDGEGSSIDSTGHFVASVTTLRPIELSLHSDVSPGGHFVATERWMLSGRAEGPFKTPYGEEEHPLGKARNDIS